MLQQQVVSLLACLLTHLGIRSDLATNDLLEPAQNTLPYGWGARSEEHTSELQSHHELVCRLLLEKKKHNLSSSKGPKPLQLKLLTTYIPKTSAFTLAFSTSQRLRTTRASARTFFTFVHYITPAARNF